MVFLVVLYVMLSSVCLHLTNSYVENRFGSAFIEVWTLGVFVGAILGSGLAILVSACFMYKFWYGVLKEFKKP